MFVLLNRVNKNEYNILDTSDGVIDSCDYRDIIFSVLEGVEIQGVTIKDDEIISDNLDVKYVKHIIGNKRRLYPTKEQKVTLNMWIELCRRLWNKMLEDRIKYYENCCEMLYNHYSEYYSEIEGLCNVPAHMLQTTERNLNIAYKNFFMRLSKGVKNVGRPKFKSFFDSVQSCQMCNVNNSIRFVDVEIQRDERDKTPYKKTHTTKIKFPKMSEPVKIVMHRPIIGTIKTVTISRNACGQFFCSMNTEEWVEVSTKKTENIVGIDLGIESLVTMSDGTKIENDKELDKYLEQLKYYRQCYARTKKGSHRREKLRKKIARICMRITNIRRDKRHKITNKIVNENDVIVTEDLNIKGMLSNRTHSRKKRTRSRHISDACWYEILRQLEYKSCLREKVFQKVSRTYPSTQLCHICGYQYTRLRGNTSLREWVCPSCNTYHDRDINAAVNIRNKGMELLGIS